MHGRRGMRANVRAVALVGAVVHLNTDGRLLGVLLLLSLCAFFIARPLLCCSEA